MKRMTVYEFIVHFIVPLVAYWFGFFMAVYYYSGQKDCECEKNVRVIEYEGCIGCEPVKKGECYEE